MRYNVHADFEDNGQKYTKGDVADFNEHSAGVQEMADSGVLSPVDEGTKERQQDKARASDGLARRPKR